MPSTYPFLVPPEGLLCSSITEIRSIYGADAGEEKSRSIQVGLTNSSLAFTFVASCLSFSSPPLHICRFHLPFSFAVLFCLFHLPFSIRPSSACFLFACVPCAFNMLASSLAENLVIWILIHLLISLRDPIMLIQLLVS